MSTLKQLATTKKVVMEDALRAALTGLKTYIDAQDAQGDTASQEAIQAVSERLDTLIGAQEGDIDKVLNTFNEIKAFLADYSEDDTLASLINAANAAVSNEAARAAAAEQANAQAIAAETTRAQGAESALGTRIATLEEIEVMSAQDATDVFNEVFHPVQPEPEPEPENEPEPEGE